MMTHCNGKKNSIRWFAWTGLNPFSSNIPFFQASKQDSAFCLSKIQSGPPRNGIHIISQTCECYKSIYISIRKNLRLTRESSEKSRLAQSRKLVKTCIRAIREKSTSTQTSYFETNPPSILIVLTSLGFEENFSIKRDGNTKERNIADFVASWFAPGTSWAMISS